MSLTQRRIVALCVFLVLTFVFAPRKQYNIVLRSRDLNSGQYDIKGKNGGVNVFNTNETNAPTTTPNNDAPLPSEPTISPAITEEPPAVSETPVPSDGATNAPTVTDHPSLTTNSPVASPSTQAPGANSPSLPTAPATATPSTAAPSTNAPSVVNTPSSTATPSTEAPGANSPTSTEGPVTAAPSTNAPSLTTAPSTATPSTEAPSVNSPTSAEGPVTTAPSTNAPSLTTAPATVTPSTEAPSINSPTSAEGPVTTAPSTNAPSLTTAPATVTPSTEAPSINSPTSAEGPVTTAPSTNAPRLTTAPATATPLTEAPSDDSPTSTDGPVTTAPSSDAPSVVNTPSSTAIPSTEAPSANSPTSTEVPVSAAPSSDAPSVNIPSSTPSGSTNAPATATPTAEAPSATPSSLTDAPATPSSEAPIANTPVGWEEPEPVSPTDDTPEPDNSGRLVYDGSIVRGAESTAVNYVKFRISTADEVEIDVLSAETTDSLSFFDVSDMNNPVLEAQNIVMQNDDAPFGTGKDDGSIAELDSYIKMNLDAGDYVIAVGRYPMNTNDAIQGFSRNRNGATPHTCDSILGNHGNYRVSLKSSSITHTIGPNTYVGSKCNNQPSDQYSKCPYQNTDEEAILATSMVQGTIYRRNERVSVDHITFSTFSTSTVIIDLLSYEAINQNGSIRYKDLNRDCDSAYIDSSIYLFENNGTDNIISSDNFIVKNDDDTKYALRNGNSENFRDSYLELNLPTGNYILAVGAHPLRITDAINGYTISNSTIFTPTTCGKSGEHGNYEITFKAKAGISVNSPNTFIGSNCDSTMSESVCT